MTDADEDISPSRLAEAVAFAASIHRGQIRKKTGAPTVSHLLAVAALVLEHGGDEDEVIAALLHDGPEDCAGEQTLEEIRRRFGDRIADIVLGCTDSLIHPAPPWRQRKEDYLRRLPDEGESVHLVSVADKVHNVRSLVTEYCQVGEDLWQRFAPTREESLWYYSALLDVFRSRPSARIQPLIDRLDHALTELVRLTDRSRERARHSP